MDESEQPTREPSALSRRLGGRRTPRGPGESKAHEAHRYQRHLFMTGASLTVIAIVLLLSLFEGNRLFDSGELSWSARLLPYGTNLAGVLLFIMNTSRRKREAWKLREYWGDHLYRIAQSFAYLFIVMWAWANAAKNGDVAASLPLNVLGFLVGLFILRVERAMEAMGDKFEETLMAILPRSVAYVTAEERRRQQLRAVYKLDDVVTQYEAVRPQIDDLGARELLDERMAAAQTAAEGDDPDTAKKAITDLVRDFEEVKRGVGEVLVPVEDLLTSRRRD